MSLQDRRLAAEMVLQADGAAATEHSELSVNAVERHTTAQSLPMHRWHCHGAACTATEHAATAALPAATAAATATEQTEASCCGPGDVTVDVIHVHAPSPGKKKLTDQQRKTLLTNLLQSNSEAMPGRAIGRARFLIGGDMNTAAEHAATAALPAATAAAIATEQTEAAATRTATKHAQQAEALMQTSRSVQITVESSVSGEQIFGPLRIQRTQSTSSLLRQLQHIAYTEHQSALLVRLTFDDCLLDSSKPVMQYHAATEHMDVESEPKVVFKMIAEPLLLTWEQLFAMYCFRKRAGRGGKAACLKQRELRAFCFENNIARVDLARSAYNWRLLLKTMPCLNTPDVIGPGIVGFSFCLLSEIDPNYAAERHVFELTCANGDRWHLHFHQRGNCDRRHLPWSRDNAEPASASERRLSADGAAATELPSACVRACVPRLSCGGSHLRLLG